MLHAHAPAFFWIKGKGPWINGETLGAAQMPGNWATPNSHGLGISKGSKNPDLAWDFVKYLTDSEVATQFARIASVLTGIEGGRQGAAGALPEGRSAGLPGAEAPSSSTPTRCAATGGSATTAASRTAFWPEFQSAMLGRKDAKTALADADRRVSRELRRA